MVFCIICGQPNYQKPFFNRFSQYCSFLKLFSIAFARGKVWVYPTLLISDALRDLILFVQFKKSEKHPRRSVTFSKVAG